MFIELQIFVSRVVSLSVLPQYREHKYTHWRYAWVSAQSRNFSRQPHFPLVPSTNWRLVSASQRLYGEMI